MTLYVAMLYQPVILGLKFNIRIVDLTARDVMIVTCPSCHWTASVAPHVLHARYHELRRLIDLEQDITCKRCGQIPEELKICLNRRAADDAIAASEDLMDLDKPARTPVEAMCLDVVAARANPASPNVLRARRLLQRRLSHKPGPLDGSIDRFGELWKRGKNFANFEKK